MFVQSLCVDFQFLWSQRWGVNMLAEFVMSERSAWADRDQLPNGLELEIWLFVFTDHLDLSTGIHTLQPEKKKKKHSQHQPICAVLLSH